MYRERDPGDRSIVRIWLTDEGRNLMKVLPSVGAQTINKAAEGISEVESKAALKILDQVDESQLHYLLTSILHPLNIVLWLR
ncbi:MarR family winged helix-turn-helix transcriptional regulator (plasmid) [Nostoc sp. UHCC 0302]|uniref:MarR family winged helix-turn-helix transcriptional regulator n=1 Tax=Nostoc sp. UHCC 0302 TaxID=3134896 RepID=UPI00311CD4ED